MGYLAFDILVNSNEIMRLYRFSVSKETELSKWSLVIVLRFSVLSLIFMLNFPLRERVFHQFQ